MNIKLKYLNVDCLCIIVPNPPRIQVIQINSTAVNVTWQQLEPVTGFHLTLRKMDSDKDPLNFDLAAEKMFQILANLGMYDLNA